MYRPGGAELQNPAKQGGIDGIPPCSFGAVWERCQEGL